MGKILLAALMVGLAGCAQPQNYDDAKILARVEDLNRKVADQANQLNELRTRQTETSNGLLFLKGTVENAGLADFDPVTSQGYQILDAGIGKLMVSVEDISPYGDGVKIQLAVGNPNSTVMNGLSGEATYGPATSEMQKMGVEAWQAKIKTTQLSIPDSISPGRWNKVAIVLPSVSATDLGRLMLTLKGNRIQMLR
jgi:hypothetical protein